MKREQPKIHLIVAMAENGAIGIGGDMPWKRGLPADLKHFKSITMGHPVVMGRKTFGSLPGGALPGRQNIVVSRSTDLQIDGACVVHSVAEALEVAEDSDVYVIGGGEIYRHCMPLASELHVTLVHATWPSADTFFPDINIDEWVCQSIEEYPADDRNLYPYAFTHWRRKAGTVGMAEESGVMAEDM